MALKKLLADVFALYVKTKNFHWQSGGHFRDYHLLLDEHAEQVFAMTDDIAERARKIGGTRRDGDLFFVSCLFDGCGREQLREELPGPGPLGLPGCSICRPVALMLAWAPGRGL